MPVFFTENEASTGLVAPIHKTNSPLSPSRSVTFPLGTLNEAKISPSVSEPYRFISLDPKRLILAFSARRNWVAMKVKLDISAEVQYFANSTFVVVLRISSVPVDLYD